MTQDVGSTRFIPIWSISLVGMTGLAVAMGIGRFAYTPLLPIMVENGWFSLQDGALLATLNLAGYFAGALSGIAFGGRYRILIVSGLSLTAICVLLMGVLHGLMPWIILRAIAGAASAWALIGLTHWSIGRLREVSALDKRGVVFAGPGVGIAFSGILVSVLHSVNFGSATLWTVLGLLAGGAAVVVIHQSCVATPPLADAPSSPMHTPARLPPPAILLVISYSLAGFGYINIVTFLPLITAQTLHSGSASAFLWPILGIFAALGAIMLGRMQVRHNVMLLACAYFAQALSVALPALSGSIIALVTSSILVGTTFMAIVMLTMHEARARYAHASLVSILTSGYALGQIFGPFVAARILRETHSFNMTLLISAALLSVAGILTIGEKGLWLRHRRKNARVEK